MAEKFDNPNYNPEAGMKYLATHFEMFKPEVAKAMIADAKRKGVKIPPVVEAKARKAGILNSVRNAKFKVGDTVEAIRDRVHKLGVKGTVLKVGADTMVVKWADDGFTASYGIEGNFKNLTKEPKATPEDKMKAELSRSGAGSNPRTAQTWLTRNRRGLVSKYGREVYEKVMREATRGLLNAQIRSTNARLKVGDRVEVTWNPDGQKKGIVGKTGELLKISSEGTALVDIDGHEYFTDRVYLKLANSVRSTNAVVAKAMAMNASDPYLGEKLKLMLARAAVSVSGGGKPSVGDIVFEYRGKKYYIGKDSAHMVKQFADAGLVKMVNSSDKVSANSVVAKALNAVRNAWADAPDAATAKRDVEQTVRKATEIAKKQSGAKATYKLTPNDNYWCGYIELIFNTEEEAKKYNPYYLFNELGDNKSILPKWSWAISSFNYQKNGKVVKIFVGRLAT